MWEEIYIYVFSLTLLQIMWSLYHVYLMNTFKYLSWDFYLFVPVYGYRHVDVNTGAH